MSTDPQALYQAVVLEHAKNPRNEGPLKGATHSAQKTNPLCGDRITVHLRVQEGRITIVTFEGRGCAVTRASASLLTEQLERSTVDEARAQAATLKSVVDGGRGTLGPLEPLRAAAAVPSRRRCATLPRDAALAALDED